MGAGSTGRRVWVAALAFAFLGASLWVALAGDPHWIDRELSLWVHAASPPWLSDVMKVVTAFGSTAVLALVAAATALYLVVRGDLLRGVFALALAVVTMVGNSLLKIAFQVQRPDLIEGIVAPTTYGYPSGHAMGSTVVYGALACVIAREAPSKGNQFSLATAILVIFICLSRIVLGVHWPSDVVGGTAMGLLLLVASSPILASR